MQRKTKNKILLLSALVWMIAGTAHAQLTESDMPIDITAKRLEVQQNERLAIFTGDVIAIQEGRQLAAQQMTVFFAEKENAAEGEEGWGDISRMRADGEVRYSTGEEAATGEWGVYDAVAGTITLYENVIVTRGENILRGDKLTVNLETGKSVVTGKDVNGGSRVRGVFFPGSTDQDES